MSVFDRKLESLKSEGYAEIGVILIDPKTKKRCTVDHFGRVQYWDVDGSGAMIATVDTVRTANGVAIVASIP